MSDAAHQLSEGTPPAPSSPPAPPAPRGALRRRGARLSRWALVVLGGYYVVCVALLAVYRFVAPPLTGVQLERRLEAALAGTPYAERKRFVPLARIPKHVVHAVVAAEDGRFWSHWGFDLGQMRDAGVDALKGEGLRGASTIDQQLVKNLFGCTCRNPVRKLYDYALTPPAVLILGKERILELYLNEVEWGPGVFGVDAAARHHYGTGARGLSRAQAAGLAALLPNPLERSPGNTAEYRGQILDRMSFRGW
ncbi:MAG: transglycosylase domain-containing protein [Gemmatimonadaceae bacterium]